MMTRNEALDYEVRSSCWASLVSWRWAQDIAAMYFAWKTRRKWARYKASIVPRSDATHDAAHELVDDDAPVLRDGNGRVLHWTGEGGLYSHSPPNGQGSGPRKQTNTVFEDLRLSMNAQKLLGTAETRDMLLDSCRQASQWVEHGAMRDDERRDLKATLDQAESMLAQ